MTSKSVRPEELQVLAGAYVDDLRRQVGRLEQQVDDLQGELRLERERFAEELRRKDILLQGAQQQITTLVQRVRALPAPEAKSPEKSEAPLRQSSDARRVPDARRAPPNGRLHVEGWPSLNLDTASRR